MAKKVVGRIKRQKGKFYYVDKQGNIVEADRKDMMKNKRKSKKKKR
ncbi:hypothetical protein [Methanotorris igneus]|uniref:Uncharacterized protein n=1 Tax=Methanotorris igneus (strain DSM 5666 / JCM 11834 / Kol 5) TaxID=880724 RepID=F6BBP7_METIK|nr:hypothetical protein [Methanotorris igneus]AEF96056.1 hypothetical protein Metig_0500 [Methanotorris igneus Kol 5]